MYQIIRVILFFFVLKELKGQQNLFNIPSGDITPKNKVFYQHQFNVYQKKFESKAHFVYGLGNGWDIGANLVGKGAYFTPEWRLLYSSDESLGNPLFPVLMGTIQKQFRINDEFNINIGTQAGANLSRNIRNKEFNHFTYGLANYQPKFGRKLVVGVYKTNRMFVGTGNTAGWMLGYEWKLTKKWYLMGDWISGNNDSSVGVLGFMYVPTKRLQLCSGYLFPNPKTPKAQGIVFEINILGWDYE